MHQYQFGTEPDWTSFTNLCEMCWKTALVYFQFTQRTASLQAVQVILVFGWWTLSHLVLSCDLHHYIQTGTLPGTDMESIRKIMPESHQQLKKRVSKGREGTQPVFLLLFKCTNLLDILISMKPESFSSMTNTFISPHIFKDFKHTRHNMGTYPN